MSSGAPRGRRGSAGVGPSPPADDALKTILAVVQELNNTMSAFGARLGALEAKVTSATDATRDPLASDTASDTAPLARRGPELTDALPPSGGAPSLRTTAPPSPSPPPASTSPDASPPPSSDVRLESRSLESRPPLRRWTGLGATPSVEPQTTGTGTDADGGRMGLRWRLGRRDHAFTDRLSRVALLERARKYDEAPDPAQASNKSLGARFKFEPRLASAELPAVQKFVYAAVDYTFEHARWPYRLRGNVDVSTLRALSVWEPQIEADLGAFTLVETLIRYCSARLAGVSPTEAARGVAPYAAPRTADPRLARAAALEVYNSLDDALLFHTAERIGLYQAALCDALLALFPPAAAAHLRLVAGPRLPMQTVTYADLAGLAADAAGDSASMGDLHLWLATWTEATNRKTATTALAAAVTPATPSPRARETAVVAAVRDGHHAAEITTPRPPEARGQVPPLDLSRSPSSSARGEQRCYGCQQPGHRLASCPQRQPTPTRGQPSSVGREALRGLHGHESSYNGAHGDTSQRTPRSPRSQCWTCGQEGHRAVQCPARQLPSAGHTPRPERASAATTPADTPREPPRLRVAMMRASEQRGAGEQHELAAMPPRERDVFPALVNHRMRARVFADPGSDVNIMSSAFAVKSGIDIGPPLTRNVATIDNKPVVMIGSAIAAVTMRYQLHGYSPEVLAWSALVFDVVDMGPDPDTDILLGRQLTAAPEREGDRNILNEIIYATPRSTITFFHGEPARVASIRATTHEAARTATRNVH